MRRLVRRPNVAGRVDFLVASGRLLVRLALEGQGELGVGGAAVLQDVHARLLLLVAEAQPADGAQRAEQHGGGPANPQDVHAEEGDGHAQCAAVAAEEHAGAVLGAVRVVRDLVVLLGGEERGRDHAPGAAEHVHRRRVHHVVDLQHEQQLGRGHVHHAADAADDQRGPGLDHRAVGRHGHQATERGVHELAHVQHAVLAEQLVERHAHQAGRGRAQRGGAAHLGGHARRAEDHQGGAGVEGEPAEPQQEEAQALQRRALRRQVRDAAVRQEAPVARAQDDGAHEARQAAGHVHHAGAGEVDEAAVQEQVVGVPEGGELAVTPAHAHHHGVHEAREQHGVDHVRAELDTLGDGAGHDGGGGAGEGELEEPVGVRGAVVGRGEEAVVGQRRAVLTAELGAVRVREGDAVAEHIPRDGGHAGVAHVLQEDVLGVPLRHGAHLEHGEAGLHEEDQRSAEDQPEGVTVGGELRKVGGYNLQIGGVVARHGQKLVEQGVGVAGARHGVGFLGTDEQRDGTTRG
eukprot:scaffold8200_cov277-Pinguiococcus_pyrenoidosus.AAC.3